MAKSSSVAGLLAGILNPDKIDVFGPLKYTPHDRQVLFHKLSRDRINAILFGGAAGGGKSCALLMDAIDFAVNYPGMNIACIRRTYNELEESFIKELRKRGYAKVLGAKWNQSGFFLSFPNGSRINFTYAENELDASRIQGGEYQLICIDEASLMPAAVIGMVAERLRSGDRGVPVIGLRLATNPGGVSSKYLRDRFIGPTNYGTKGVVTDEDDQTVAFIQSKYTDNPHIDPGYEKILNAIADPFRRAQMRDGDWDSVPGAFFENWQRLRHVIPSADCFTPPPEWQRYCGIDYGIRDPFAAIWAAVDNDGRLWVYREITMPGIQAQDQAKLIIEAEQFAKEPTVVRVADPSMWGDRGTPLSIADIYGMNGCGIAKANNDRLNGWARVHAALSDDVACEYHRALDWEKCPMLHVMENTCPVLIESMPALPRSKTKPEDAETRGVEDHTIDALRYLVMMAGTHASPVIYNDKPLDPAAIQSLQDESRAAYSTGYDEPVRLVAGRFAGSLAPDYDR